MAIDCICSCCTPNLTDMYACTNYSKQKYCDLYNLKFVFETIENFDKHPAWYKIVQILRLFDKYETVLYIDADAGFIKYDVDINNYFDSVSDVVLCKTDGSFNTGVFTIKRSDKTIAALNYALILYDEYKSDPFYEQTALIEAFKKYDVSITQISDALFNASPFNSTKETVILHLMGMIKEHLTVSHWMNYFLH